MLVSLCSLLVISMLILLLFLVWLRVFLLVGLLILPWLTPLGKGQMLLASSGWRIVLVLVGTSLSVVLIRWLLLLLVTSRIGGSLFIFLSLPASAFVVGLLGPVVSQPVLTGPPHLYLVRSRMSGISNWDEPGLVPPAVVLALRDAFDRSDVDDFWFIWSENAEAGLFSAYCEAGGPIAAGSSAFLGRGLLRIRSRRLGGRAVGGRGASRLYRVSQSDEVDVHSVPFFVNSSLAPVLLFRRRLKSVADVLKGIGQHGFTQAGWDALQRFWAAVCRHGHCGPICSLDLWNGWVPPDLHGFCKWVFDALDVLSDFTRQVVVSRRDAGLNWLREDLGSRPNAWLRPDFCSFISLSCHYGPSDSVVLGFWWNLIFLMPSFVKLGCLFSVGLVILSFLLISFW